MGILPLTAYSLQLFSCSVQRAACSVQRAGDRGPGIADPLTAYGFLLFSCSVQRAACRGAESGNREVGNGNRDRWLADPPTPRYLTAIVQSFPHSVVQLAEEGDAESLRGRGLKGASVFAALEGVSVAEPALQRRKRRSSRRQYLLAVGCKQ